MREILFRGKRVYDNEWVYGNLINWHPKINPRIIYYEDCEIEQFKETNHQVFKNTIGQFTGLTDKNGVKIFEGDIIKTDDNDIINVSYGIQNIDAFETIGFNLYEFYGNYEDRGKGIRLQSSIEIIGNIHE